MKRQAFLLKRGHPTEGHVMLIGDSLVYNFFRFPANRIVFEEEIGTYINYGVDGDRISNVLWRIEYHKYPPAIYDIIQVGTNVTNRRSNADEITSGIMQVVSALYKNKSDVIIILTGIFPGQRKPVKFIGVVNYLLEKYSRKVKQVFYLKPVFKDWINPDLTLKRELYNGDLLRFTAGGYMVFAKYIQEISLLSKTQIPQPIKFELPPWGPDEVGIGEPISFCTTDSDPTAAARGPWYDKIVKPEERGVLKFNAHTYGVW